MIKVKVIPMAASIIQVYWTWFHQNDTPLDKVWDLVDQQLGQKLFEQITEGQDDIRT